MAILVTGGAGYIGCVTVERLIDNNAEVVVLDDLVRGHRTSIPARVPLYQGSVGDTALVRRILREHPIDECIHFAALAYVGESVAEPARYFENNTAQGIAFVGALLSAEVKRLVLSSTCATYGEPQQALISEACAQWPTNPYGWSKLILERVLASYDLAYGLKFVSLRYFNAAGATSRCGEQHELESQRLIPNVLAAAAGERPDVAVFGGDYPTPDGTAIRDYVHVSDLAEAHLGALKYLRSVGSSDFLNLGTSKGHSVLQVIDAARQLTGAAIPVRMEARRPGDPAMLVADARKARAVLGWEPVASDISTIIRSQWEWRKKFPNGYPDS